MSASLAWCGGCVVCVGIIVQWGPAFCDGWHTRISARLLRRQGRGGSREKRLQGATDAAKIRWQNGCRAKCRYIRRIFSNFATGKKKNASLCIDIAPHI